MVDKSVVLVGGGRSVKVEGLDLFPDFWDRLKNYEIWSLNYSFSWMPYLPKREIWVDRAFFDKNREDLFKLWRSGVKMCSKKDNWYAQLNHDFGEAITTYHDTRSPNGYHGWHAFNSGLDKFLYVGKSGMCGHFALSLAFAEHYTKIFLLGYDAGTPSFGDTKTHWYQEQAKFSTSTNLGVGEKFSTGVGVISTYLQESGKLKPNFEDFNIYLPHMDEFKIKVYNVSQRSNISAFPKIDYATFFNLLKEETV